MPKPWTSKLIIKQLGVQKCNGSLDAAVENLTLEQAMNVAREKADLGHLTGADLKAQGPSSLGSADRIIVGKNKTTVVGGGGDKKATEERAELLR
ncbi:MAG: hypothetical protein VXV85_06260, partial [Candidatus Thermoplasmatota archaeon]|nr:hypothetical protein [Candidatus Thermoplasmatota archaeon]